ncbi:MAG: MarR family transcriptional regulator [Peptococcaceae bacterium]|jgi:DNA-binding MarR family transcriptional regulator|nr:MarR family transcriptional regulator [Peptococcaceae bacterium]
MNDKKNEQVNEKANLMALFMRVAELLHLYHFSQRKEHGPLGNPHRGQGRILAMLKMQPEMSQKDLGFLLGMSKQALSELLAKLEKNSYIERTPSEQDKRVMHIKLTEQGKNAAPDLSEEDQDSIFEGFNEDEQEQFAGYLKRVIADVEKTLEDNGISQMHAHLREEFIARGGFGGPNRDGGMFGRFDPRMMGGMPGGLDMRDAPWWVTGFGRNHDDSDSENK